MTNTREQRLMCKVGSRFNFDNSFAERRIDPTNPVQVVSMGTDALYRVFQVSTDFFRAMQEDDGTRLEPIQNDMWTRTRQSTVGAVGDVLSGVGNIVTGKPITGIARIGAGALSVLDAPIAVAADFTDVVGGVRYDVGYALSSENVPDSAYSQQIVSADSPRTTRSNAGYALSA